MATLSEIKQFIAGTDLISQIQQDVQNIESTNFTTVEQGWSDLESISNDSEYSSLVNDPNGITKSYIQGVQNTAENYMQGVTLWVAQPNNPGGLIQLFANTAYYDSDGDIQYVDPSTTASLWGVISGQQTNLVNSAVDAEDFVNDGSYEGLNTAWSWSGSLSSLYDYIDNQGDEEWAYQGSPSAWAPFISLQGGDDTALNQAAFL